MYAWDENEKDTPHSYAAFKVFLALPSPRRLRAVAEEINRHRTQVAKWSAKYNWFERARLYDAYVNPIIDDEEMDAKRALQMRVMQDEARDYDRMHGVFSIIMEEIEERATNLGVITDVQDTVDDLSALIDGMKKVVQARDGLSRQIRRTARMPNTYRPKDEEPTEPTGEYMLTAGGVVTIDEKTS